MRVKGFVLASLDKNDEAIKVSDRALAINPNSPIALLGKGLAIVNLGRISEGIVYFDKVLADKPEKVSKTC